MNLRSWRLARDSVKMNLRSWRLRRCSVLSILWLSLRAVSGQEENAVDSFPVEVCQHENFYCDLDDPSVFYRCMDHVLYTFHCPSGLNFSPGSQNCDWPQHVEDKCSGLDSSQESTIEDHQVLHGEEDSSVKGSHHSTDENSDKSNHQGTEDKSHTGEELSNVIKSEPTNDSGFKQVLDSSWISQAAASGKSWWRPHSDLTGRWLDVATIHKPAFQPHIPDKPTPKPQSDDQDHEEEEHTGEAETDKSGSADGAKKSEDSAVTWDEHGSSQSVVDGRHDSSSVEWKDGSCASSCQLPSCHCPGTAVPAGLSASSVPQMVMLTFDDEVSGAFYGYYQRLFRPGRYNPNGCPIRGCLYVSGHGTNYDLVYPLYAMGVEIASHTITHRFPHTWWSTASYEEFVEEASGMRENLISKAGIPRESIKGFRVPFLQLGGDNMYSALYDSHFVYDTSMFTGSQWEGEDPIWPFTLDYVPSTKICQHYPCPKKQYPGMWEIPVQRWYGLDGHSCAMPDGCTSTGDAEETLEYLKSNFRRYYGSNRAPFGIFIHARWFLAEHNLDGLDMFIDYLLTFDDVYMVTQSQVIDWMKSPTPLSSINGFEPWTCEGGAKDVWIK